jgi:FkbM family methyltransferase
MNALPRQVPAFLRTLDVTGGRLRFVCDLRDGIARETCFMGYYEPQETVLVQHLVKPGGTFVDVGANWGYFTLVAADLVGRTGRVISFEPHPELAASLQANVTVNQLGTVTVVPAAVAGADGEMELEGFGPGSCNWGVSRLAPVATAGVPRYQVRTCRLPDMLDRLGVDKVDFLKMDIEGAECLVVPTLEGDLAARRFATVLLELHPAALAEQGVPAASLLDVFRRHGYRPWIVDHSQGAFRRAAYRLPQSPTEFLHPLAEDAPLGAWPHILLLAPGMNLA